MKRIFAAAVGVLGLAVAAPASAADIPYKAPYAAPAAVAPYYNWTGFYVGIQGGYAFGKDRLRQFDAGGNLLATTPRYDVDGFFGGGHAGFNWQWSSMVLGLEADIEGADISGTFTFLNGDSARTSTRWQGSLRGRLGFAAGPALFYATGGLAFADLRYRYFSAGLAATETFTGTEAGWTVGAGVEYAFAPNWTGRLEYRYTDFGTLRHTSAVVAPGITFRQDPDFHTIRAGISYKFGGPVAAAY